MDILIYWFVWFDLVICVELDYEIIVVFVNCCGQEDGVMYVGISVVVGIKGIDVKVYGIFG